ncbi:DUF3710 domain-containing protein [Tessaracoccus sp. HDW20]|nr:DUF3710 domain-containing protein [Tessaracoccus coleopterorum]
MPPGSRWPCSPPGQVVHGARDPRGDHQGHPAAEGPDRDRERPVRYRTASRHAGHRPQRQSRHARLPHLDGLRPGWLLRGVLLGKATFEPENADAQVALFEFFSNLIVRRGSQPAAPGSLLPMKVPQAEG